MKIGFQIIGNQNATVDVQDIGFDLEACHIVTDDITSLVTGDKLPGLTLDALILHDAVTASRNFGIISPCLDLESSDQSIRRNSEVLFLKQVDWMLHCGAAVIGAYLPLGDYQNFSRVLNRSVAKMGKSIMVLISSVSREAWEQWNKIRMMSSYSQNLKIGLILDDARDLHLLEKWNVEPVRNVFFSNAVFGRNRNGNPYLDPEVCGLFWKLERRGCEPIVLFDNAMGREEIRKYSDYFRFLKASQPALSLSDKITYGYEDYLQTPLQPLMDHLQFATYEAFEMDPVKYREYENAIYHALIDKMAQFNDRELVLAVVGAGRGPLVDRALSAASKIPGIKLKLYAVEKNPNAIITLYKRRIDWMDRVIIVFSDMREWNPMEKIDILVSELLGSFGDNELSPECLDGAQRLLSETGIMIPQRYDSYLAPISSPRLYESIKAYKDIKNFESPFVVKFDQVDELAEPLLVWSFEHPVNNLHIRSSFSNLHNERFSKLRFNIKSKSLIHGLGGYFEAILYKDVKISILPSTHSPGMFSWFPIFFPIHTPVLLSQDSTLNVYIWRLTDKTKVWYEWAIESCSFGSSAIHNPNGQSFWIGL